MRGRHPHISHARFARTHLSQYTKPATVSDRRFVVPFKCQVCQCCNRTEPTEIEAQVVTEVKGKQNRYEIRF